MCGASGKPPPAVAPWGVLHAL
ncbi:MAG: hypothetical protein GX254_03915 [Clostridiales bacterium]|nr:hypothetical protein [Clostridiales bacterium]